MLPVPLGISVWSSGRNPGQPTLHRRAGLRHRKQRSHASLGTGSKSGLIHAQLSLRWRKGNYYNFKSLSGLLC